MKTKVLLATVAAAMLLPVSAAFAAPISGTGTDMTGDATVLDVATVGVTYDDELGTIEATATLAPDIVPAGTLALKLGTAQTDGSCATTGLASLTLTAPLAAASVATLTFIGAATPVAAVAGVVSGELATGQTVTYIFPSADGLLDRSYSCATAIVATAPAPAPDPPEEPAPEAETDEVAAFCLGTCPSEPPIEPTTVEWTAPTTGDTVSGVLTENGTGAQACLAEVTGPVHHTVNFLDGEELDEQGVAPWGCTWDTTNVADGEHVLQVRAYNAEGNVLDTDTVTVTVDNPDPVPPAEEEPPAEEQPPPVQEQPPVQQQPVAVVPVAGQDTVPVVPVVATPAAPVATPVAAPAPSAPAPTAAASATKKTLAPKAASAHVTKVLKQLFGKEFRASTLVRQAKRANATTINYKVTWTSARYRYRGTVKVFLTDTLHYKSHIERLRK